MKVYTSTDLRDANYVELPVVQIESPNNLNLLIIEREGFLEISALRRQPIKITPQSANSFLLFGEPKKEEQNDGR